MRIQHNIMAMNAYRNYNTNTSALSKNLEKLSSGYKINRAGDDAAGLAISEKMRAQITGLNAAQKNVKDGISLVKTAEGAMQEIQDMLNRMDYLATQSANGTYDDQVDRYNLQKEVNQLRSEIDRIADSANFNGIKLLNGDMSLGEPETTTVSVAVNTVNSAAGVTAQGGTFSGVSGQLDANFIPGTTGGIGGIHTGTSGQQVQGASFTIDLSAVTFTGADTTNAKTITVAIGGGFTISLAVTAAAADGLVSGAAFAASFQATSSQVQFNGVTFDVANNNGKLTFTVAAASITGTVMAGSINTVVNGGTVTLTGPGAVEGGQIHGLQDVQIAKAETPASLAGISFKLDGTVVGDGNTLKIGDKTFIFKVGAGSTVSQGAGQTLITVDAANTAGFEDAARQIALSATTISDTATGLTDQEFKVSLVDGDTIHLDQVAVTDTKAYDTETKLKSLFEVVQKTTDASKATIELSATPGAASGLNEGDLVSYKTKDNEGNDVVKSYIIGTAPTGAKNPENYITAASFNALLQTDANNSLKAAADEVLAGTSYAGQYDMTVNSSGNVVITAVNAGGVHDDDELDAIKDAIQDKAQISISKISADDVAKSGLTLQIGDTSDAFNRLKVNVGDMHVDAMGTMETKVEGGRQTAVSGKSIGDIDISTLEGAQDAIDVIKNAINYVSSIRGDLGATQNRLEHTANNLSVMAENIQDAESTIRDTDVAEEMMAYTKNNILIQSAQAMLAQANAVPQGVLQLLG